MHTTPDQNAHDEVIEAYRAHLQAMTDGDTEALDDMLDDGFALTHITGYEQPKTEWLSQMRAGRFGEGGDRRGRRRRRPPRRPDRDGCDGLRHARELAAATDHGLRPRARHLDRAPLNPGRDRVPRTSWWFQR